MSRAHDQPTRRTPRSRLSWSTWAAVAAGGWSLFYLLLGCSWWAGGRGYPFGHNDEGAPDAGSLLSGVDAGTGAPAIVLIGVVSVVLAWVMAERRGTGWRRGLVIAAGWAVALFPVVAVLDARSVTLLPPLGLFGWTMIRDWPHLNQLLVAAGVLLWICATTAYTRHTRATGPEAAQRAARRARAWVRAGRVATVVACLCPVPYIVIRCSWAVGHPIGVPPSFVAMLNRNQPGIAFVELTLALMAAVGILLTWGLGRRWGRIFPSWLPVVGGRQVPLWFPVSFATCAAVALFPFGRTAWYGLLGVDIVGSQDDVQVWGFDPDRPEFWGLGGLGWLFPLWAVALAVAVTGYDHRYRPPPRPPGGERAAAPRRLVLGVPSRYLATALVAVTIAAVTMVVLHRQGDPRGWIVASNPSLPEPTGPHPVGVRHLRMVDMARPEPFVETTSARELMVSVLYPASDVDGDGFALQTYARNPYLPEPLATEWGTERSRRLGLRDDAVNWQFRTWAREFAPVLPGRYPVVVLSPPLRATRWSSTSTAEELASHGYVVIAVDHTHEAPLVQFPGQRIEESPLADLRGPGPLLDRVHEVRAGDVAFVVGHLDQLGPDLEAISDVSTIGLHGYAGAGTDHLDRLTAIPGMGAIAALPDGPAAGGEARTEGERLRDVPTPLLLLGGDLPPAGSSSASGPGRQSASAPGTGTGTGTAGSTPGPGSGTATGSRPVVGERSCGWRVHVGFAGATPPAFTDAAAYLPSLASEHRHLAATVAGTIGTADPATVTRLVRRYVVAFFDLHLKDRPSPVLTAPDRPQPAGVTVSTVSRGDCP